MKFKFGDVTSLKLFEPSLGAKPQKTNLFLDIFSTT